MELSALVNELDERTAGRVPVRIVGAAEGIAVTSVTHDSRTVTSGSLFACLRGTSFDGHDHVTEAIERGAAALLVDHELATGTGIVQLVVADTRVVLGPIAAAVHGHPSRAMTTVGITGTNGKTTIAQLIATIFRHHGWKTGVIGTIQGPRTTPEAPELQSMLESFRDEGAAAAVLEVSSHALALHRVDGTEFNAVVYSNLGRDHLDLHGSTEEYFRAKARLFQPSFSTLAVINVDDMHGRLLADTLADAHGMRVVTVTLDDICDIEVTSASHSYRWRGLAVTVPIGGRFNVSNSLIALVTAGELGVEPEVAIRALLAAEAVPGRFESVATAAEVGYTVIVDYAHTPDGLAEVLAAARAIGDQGGSVAVVFGAGGERDHDKRPEMGAVASRLADLVVVTSDNPRREDPTRIIGDILAGVDESGANVIVEVDRRRAIAEAIHRAGPGDVVVIAGKGHERTQDLGDQIVEFDDRVVARQLVGERS